MTKHGPGDAAAQPALSSALGKPPEVIEHNGARYRRGDCLKCDGTGKTGKGAKHRYGRYTCSSCGGDGKTWKYAGLARGES